MFTHKVKMVSVLLVALGLLAAGANAADKPGDKPANADKAAKPADPADNKNDKGDKNPPPAAGAELQGTIKAVDAVKNSITIHLASKGQAPEDKTLELARDVRVLLPGPRGGKDGQAPAGKVADLATGQSVTLSMSPDFKTVLAIGIQAPSVIGSVKSVDAAKKTLTLTMTGKGGNGGGDQTFDVAADARLSIPGGGKNQGAANLGELAQGTTVSLSLSMDRKTVLAIAVQGQGGGNKK